MTDVISGFTAIGDSFYKFIGDAIRYNAARSHCQSLGHNVDLAAFETFQEWYDVKTDILNDNGKYK